MAGPQSAECGCFWNKLNSVSRLKKGTSSVACLYGLRPSDTGRPLAVCDPKPDGPSADGTRTRGVHAVYMPVSTRAVCNTVPHQVNTLYPNQRRSMLPHAAAAGHFSPLPLPTSAVLGVVSYHTPWPSHETTTRSHTCRSRPAVALPGCFQVLVLQYIEDESASRP